MTFAVIRVRGKVGVRNSINATLAMLRLHRVNHCVLIPETPEYRGMLQKVKDYVTWGEIEPDTLEELLRQRGRLAGGKPITDKYIKSNTDYSSVQEFARAVVQGDAKFTDLQDIVPVIRLHPPRKGYEGIKRAYIVGGALGYRGAEINALLRRML